MKILNQEEDRKRRKKQPMGHRKQKARWCPTIPIIRLSINGLNVPIKRQTVRLSEKKQDPILCRVEEIYFKYKGWE